MFLYVTQCSHSYIILCPHYDHMALYFSVVNSLSVIYMCTCQEALVNIAVASMQHLL